MKAGACGCSHQGLYATTGDVPPPEQLFPPSPSGWLRSRGKAGMLPWWQHPACSPRQRGGRPHLSDEERKNDERERKSFHGAQP
jgi:hypothetical protein